LAYDPHIIIREGNKLDYHTKFKANGLISYFKTFDAIALLTVWVKLLQCNENRNVILQAGDISLDVQAENIKRKCRLFVIDGTHCLQSPP